MRSLLLKSLVLSLTLATVAGAAPIKAAKGPVVDVYRLTADAIQLPLEDTSKERKLREAVAADPSFADAHFRLSSFYQETGNYDASIKSIVEARRLAPDNAYYADYQGSQYVLLGRMNEGIKTFSAELAAHPERTALYKQIVLQQFSLERYSAALTTIKAWKTAVPESSAARFWEGRVLKFAERYNEAKDALREALALDPSNEFAGQEFLSVCATAKNWDDAVTLFKDMTEQFPGNAFLWYALATAYSESGDAANATVAGNQQLALKGTDDLAIALNNVARILERGGDFDSALSTLFDARRADLRSEFTHDRIKDLIFKVKRYQDGLDYFTRLAATNHVHYLARIIGEIAMADNQWELANKWFTKQVEAKPYKALAYAQLGLTLEHAGSLDAALGAYQNAAWFNPGIRDNFYRARQLFQKLGRVDDGIAYFEKLIAYMPDKAYLHAYLADLQLAKGDTGSALVRLRTVQALSPVEALKAGIPQKLSALEKPALR